MNKRPSSFNVGDKVKCVQPVSGLTMNRVYEVVQTGHTFTRVINDRGEQLKLYHDTFDVMFRLAPKCTCGSAHVKHPGHSYWCDSVAGVA